MRTPEEKIQFKNHFFKLGQGRLIRADDPTYWRVFWTSPKEAADIFDLLTAQDIQIVRDQNLPNMLVFVSVLISKISEFAKSSSKQSHLEILNCVRLLTKILPYVFELPAYHSEIEPRFFLASEFNPLDFSSMIASPRLHLKPPCAPCKQNSAALATTLVFSLVRLLFKANFTLEPKSPRASASPLCLWEPGLGTAANYVTPDALFDSHRSEVLRLLLVLGSSTFYERVPNVVVRGSVFMSLLVSAVPKREFFDLVCSLTNIVCRSGRVSRDDSGLEHEHTSLMQSRLTCVTLSSQLLAQMLVYPMPGAQYTRFLSDGGLLETSKPMNRVRAFFARLSKDTDLVFLAMHLLGVLRSPLHPFEAAGKQKTYRASPSPMAASVLVVFWELVHCNAAFGKLVAGKLAAKLVPCVMYHVYAFYDVPQHAHLVKLAAYFLLFLSSQRAVVKSLLVPVAESAMESFPPEFRLTGPVSTRDFIVIHVCQVLIALTADSSPKSAALTDMQTFLLPTLSECLFNIIPHTSAAISGTDSTVKGLANLNPGGGISYSACRSISQVLVLFSAQAFLTSSPRNAELLALLLRALCAAATKTPHASRMLLFSFIENEVLYNNIWSAVHGLDGQYFCGKTSRLMKVVEEGAAGNADEVESNSAQPPDTKQAAGPGPLGTVTQPRVSSDQTSIDSEYSDDYVDAAPLSPDTNSHIPGRLASNPESSIDEMEALEIEEALRPTAPSGMSAKFKEKLPRDTPISGSWGGSDALRTILVFWIPQLKSQLGENWTKRRDSVQDSYRVVKKIEFLDLAQAVEQHRPDLHYDFLPDTPLARATVSWNYLSLGWYISMLARDVFVAADTIRLHMGANRSLVGNISSSLASFGKFATSWSGISNVKPGAHRQDAAVTDYVDSATFSANLWSHTAVRLFQIKSADDQRGIQAFGMRFGSVGSATSVNEITTSLVKRFSDFRGASRASVSSAGSIYSGMDEIPETVRLSKRDSVSSLHSLNTLNRARTHTPRNSMSN